MNDLFEAIKVSIHQYMNVDSLNPRKQKAVKDTYGKHMYDIDTVESLFEFNKEDSDEK